MRRSPLLADLFLGSRIRSTPRSLRIAPPLDFGKEALKVFALICMVTRAFRRRPSIDHDAQRLGFQLRVQLQEPVELQKPHRLRSIFVSPTAHHGDMLGHNLAQHTTERFGLAQCGKSLFWITRYQRAPDRHALLYMTCLTQTFDRVVINRTGCHEVVEEPIDDASAMQERRCRPARR